MIIDRREDRPIIFYDGHCNLCNQAINTILDYERSPYYHFATLQSAVGQEIIERHKDTFENLASLDTIILLEDQMVYVKSAAVYKIARQIKFPFNLIGLGRLFGLKLSDTIYDWVAKNRYKWFGESKSCRLMTPQLKKRFL